MTELNVILEKIVTNTPKASPLEITTEVIEALESADYVAVLEKTLPVYIRQWLAGRRQWREASVEETPVPEATFAPDDLLSDDQQEVAREVVQSKKTTMLRARGSARVNAVRTEWQRHFSDSLWNGQRYIKFGDATADDLLGAAESLRTTAKAEYNGKIAKSEYYERIANALGTRRVRDLTDDPTRA